MNRRWSGYLVMVCGLFLVVIVWAALPTPRTVATADYARQTGQPCPVCHERPEGGGPLSATGAAFVRGGDQWPIPEGVGSAQAQVPARIPRVIRLIVGYVHLATAVAWFGTIFYVHFIVGAKQLTSGLPKTERTVGWISIVIMTITGTVLTLYRYQETGTVFTGSFGTVFVIKLFQFGLMVLLAFISTTVLDRRMRSLGRPEAPPGYSTEGITSESLPLLDGREGHKGVVAVDGKLYDVSDSQLWSGGVHLRRHQAGQDLTAAMKGAPHGAKVLDRVPLIGTLQTAPAEGPAQRWPAHRIFVSFAHINVLLAVGILLCVAWWKWGFSLREVPPAPTALAALSAQSSHCISCHTANEFMTAQIAEWEQSKHAANQVGCFECHRAESGEVDAMAHNGYTVSTLVSPKDCSRCHIRETEQFASSRHSRGGDILDSLDNVLGEQVEGVAAAVLGCQQCHGTRVEVDELGIPLPAGWPNTGIGRINPDDSRGACSTCHTRHLFSVAVAREPASCGNCHLGPDHPQKEIYEESKHGVAFVANRERMNLDAKPWVLGEDYTAAPTCASCHMSALPGVPANHDVGLRIAWTLRPEVSTRQENWEERRRLMMQVCQQCHSPGFYYNFFSQFDDAVELYNAKFAIPAVEIMQRLRDADELTALQFDEQIEWTFFYLWHHEGRRARHGASMMGPDFVQWHGFYEVADRFYNEFVPEAEALLPGVTEPFLQDEYHQWREDKD
jgi:hydroxylamine dehydrogenase